MPFFDDSGRWPEILNYTLITIFICIICLQHPLSLDKNRISDTVICLWVETIDEVNQISLLIFQIINGSTIVRPPKRSFAACAYMWIYLWIDESFLCQDKVLQVLTVFFSCDISSSFCDKFKFFKLFKFFTNESL